MNILLKKLTRLTDNTEQYVTKEAWDAILRYDSNKFRLEEGDFFYKKNTNSYIRVDGLDPKTIENNTYSKPIERHIPRNENILNETFKDTIIEKKSKKDIDFTNDTHTGHLTTEDLKKINTKKNLS